MVDYVVAGLTKRYAELSGEAKAIRARLAQVDADLIHLAAVIRQFDPDCDIEGIRPKRQAGPEKAVRGERSRLILDIAREAGRPLTAAEIVAQAVRRLGHDPEDRSVLKRLAKPIETAIGRQERKGALRAIREPGQFVLWEVAR